MRKRIVSGLLILSASGTAVFFFSQPKKGSVEWHKREYLAAVDRIYGNTLMGKIRRFGTPLIPVPIPATPESEYRNLRHHRAALIESGFLQEKEFVISNTNTLKVLTNITAKLYPLKEDDPFTEGGLAVREGQTMIVVIGLPGEMAKFEELIRKANAP